LTSSRDSDDADTTAAAVEALKQALMANGISEADAQETAGKMVRMSNALPEWPPPPGSEPPAP
jgi:hypothetical protein